MSGRLAGVSDGEEIRARANTKCPFSRSQSQNVGSTSGDEGIEFLKWKAHDLGSETNFVQEIAGSRKRRVAAQRQTGKALQYRAIVSAAKEKYVGGRAPHEPGSGRPYPMKPEFIEAEAVDDYGAVVECVLLGESKYFGSALGIDTFREVNDEWLMSRRGLLLVCEIMI